MLLNDIFVDVARMRSENGILTDRELAEKLGISPSQLGNIKRCPNIIVPSYVRLCEFCGYDIELKYKKRKKKKEA